MEERNPNQGLPDVLLVMAKQPAAGRSKTRLAPPLSPAQAAALYEGFLKDTLDLMRQVPGVRRAVAPYPATACAVF
jgi:glycosyltransferase A (GT-A) superfamily protein (DUF2064 family)